MGMFDELTCKYPLPAQGANAVKYQTKSLDCELDEYEIREDGTLWHEACDREDRSDPNATGVRRIVGMTTRVNQRWEPCTDFIGEINFYGGDFDWSAYFVKGKLRELHALHDADPSQETTPHA